MFFRIQNLPCPVPALVSFIWAQTHPHTPWPVAFTPCLMTKEYESPKDLHQEGKRPQPLWELSCLPLSSRTRQ